MTEERKKELLDLINDSLVKMRAYAAARKASVKASLEAELALLKAQPCAHNLLEAEAEALRPEFVAWHNEIQSLKQEVETEKERTQGLLDAAELGHETRPRRKE